MATISRVGSDHRTRNPKSPAVKAFARRSWEGAKTPWVTHPRKPSSKTPTETRVTATYQTPLMVLITKVKMETSRARIARSHRLSS